MIRNIVAPFFLFLFIIPAFAQTSLVEPSSPTYKKARSLIIPAVTFNDASLSDVLEYFQKQSALADPEKEGVNFVLKTPETPGTKEPSVTLSLKNVPLSELLKYVSSMTNYRLDFEEHAIVFSPPETVKKASP